MYYGDKRESKVNIMEALSNLGWSIYGYKPDKSDSMTDYYCPAYWDGIATKNGYTLCIDIAEYKVKSYSGKETYEYAKSPVFYDKRTQDKIQKLQALANDSAASQGEFGEVGTALKMIEKLKANAEFYRQEAEATKTIKEKYPIFQANPGRCNWHIERNGKIITKGIGAFSFHALPWKFDCSTMEWGEKYPRDTEEEWEKYKAQYENDILKFKKFIAKLESIVSIKLGEGADQELKKIVVTEYKSELQTKESKTDDLSAELEAGMYFKLLTGFNYGCYKGSVYKIITDDNYGIKAQKMNGKLNKVLSGRATAGNYFNCSHEKFKNWVEKGAISIVEIVEVKTPYEVEKWVKKQNDNTKSSNDNGIIQTKTNNTEYEIVEDVHTQTGEKLYIVKFKNNLSRDKYIQVNAEMKSKGGYYSKFKHGFIFKENPTELLNNKNSNENKKDDLTTQQSKQTQNTDKLIGKINSQVTTLQKKIDSLRRDYKTNTYKRMREQEGRESKIESMQIDINMLEYIRDKVLNNNVTELEKALIVGAFCKEIHIHYLHKYGNQPKKPEFPQISATVGQWYNDEVPKRQTRLKKAGINNSAELEKAVDEYKIIYDKCRELDSTTEKQRQISKSESEYKLQQKGDINFTPPSVAKQMVVVAAIDKNSIVLEPSAGIGNIADEIKKTTQNIECCEYMTHFQELLRLKGFNVIGDDFLQMQKYNYYDAIIMNPPFSKNQDIEHLQHAYKLLKDGGRLVCITSLHWTFARDKASVEFRNWMQNITYDTIELKSGTFEMTGVSSKIVVIYKDEQAQQEAV